MSSSTPSAEITRPSLLLVVLTSSSFPQPPSSARLPYRRVPRQLGHKPLPPIQVESGVSDTRQRRPRRRDDDAASGRQAGRVPPVESHAGSTAPRVEGQRQPQLCELREHQGTKRQRVRGHGSEECRGNGRSDEGSPRAEGIRCRSRRRRDDDSVGCHGSDGGSCVVVFCFCFSGEREGEEEERKERKECEFFFSAFSFRRKKKKIKTSLSSLSFSFLLPSTATSRATIAGELPLSIRHSFNTCLGGPTALPLASKTEQILRVRSVQ